MQLRCFYALILVCGVCASEVQGGFRYADGVTTTGGQFSLSYPPSNLVNNGFIAPTNTIDTRADYIAAGNNYATVTGTLMNYNLT
ncbi:MAG: hypothetical protein NT154_06050, partial [Verrucomicrobia bacterium]|nr:hypothetical protein [Verrucomicrobiota bacterium]